MAENEGVASIDSSTNTGGGSGVGAFGVSSDQIGGPGMDSEKTAPSSGLFGNLFDRPDKLAATGINALVGLTPVVGPMLGAINMFGKALGFATGIDMPSIGDIAVEGALAIARGDVTPSTASTAQDAGKRDASIQGDDTEKYLYDTLFPTNVAPVKQPTQTVQLANSPVPQVSASPLLPTSGARNPYSPIIPQQPQVGSIWL